MTIIKSFTTKPTNYLIILAHIVNMAFAQTIFGETPAENGIHFTVSGIDGTNKFNETVCPGFNLCFDIFSFSGLATESATMSWDNAIPEATFSSNNEKLPTGHFCWTPELTDARTAPYIFHVLIKSGADEKTVTYSITVPLIKVELQTTDVTCFGNSNATATAIVNGGSGNYIYHWNNVEETTSSISGLNEGNYTVEVMDDYGCTATASTIITTPRPLILESVSTQAMCTITGGSAEIVANGGTMPYSYSWMSCGSTDAKAENLPSGVYTVIVTDANGCTAYKAVNISTTSPADEQVTERTFVKNTAEKSNVLIYPNPVENVFSVKNVSEEMVTISVMNSIGQNIYETIRILPNFTVSVPMDEQSTGIYLVKAQQQTNIEMIKVIKQ